MPGYKHYAPGNNLAAADVNDYLTKQVVMNYASDTARDADTALAAVLREGMFTYQQDDNRLTMYDGTGWVVMAEPWQTFIPVTTGLMTFDTWDYAQYRRHDGVCHIRFSTTYNSAITESTSNPGFALPIAATNAGTPDVVSGGGRLFDDSATVWYPVQFRTSGANVVAMYESVASSVVRLSTITTTAPITLAASDSIFGSFSYRMANRHSSGV